jgi:hypothetical protein
MSLKVTILALEHIPFTFDRYDGMGFIMFHGQKIHWTCTGFEEQFRTKSGQIEVTLTNPRGLTEDQIEVVSSMTAETIKCMARKGGTLHAGKVMDYGKKDWNGDDAFDHLPTRDDSQELWNS